MDKRVLRIIDANINRAKEGIRVIEDFVRFILDDKELSEELKKLRHEISQNIIDYLEILSSRDSVGDVGTKINIDSENRRENLKDIIISNFKRCQESLRVLEEFSKLYDTELAGNFKKLRYKTYHLEKEILTKGSGYLW